MQLPRDLQLALDRELQGTPLTDLAQASKQITEQYRAGKPSKLTTHTERLAYAAARMPATYAAVHNALAQASQLKPKTLLDLGAGPGTATWAASAVFPTLEKATLVERNQPLAYLGQKLGLPIPATWLLTDLAQAQQPTADLVILSYALNELSSMAPLQQAWQSANLMLAIIEPGTPKSFHRVREARAWLIKQGAHVAAPCPHENACPMTKEDWCHFAARVERTSLHRRMKGATMNYEDEKFSYIIAAKAPAEKAESRIIRHPQHKSGYIQLELCNQTGLQRQTVAKSAGALHRSARKAEWNDAWPPKQKGEPEGSPL